jgi:hypothetical protein
MWVSDRGHRFILLKILIRDIGPKGDLRFDLDLGTGRATTAS